MKKRAFIIHGWGGSPVEGWFPWLKNVLEGQSYQVTAIAMPTPDTPIIVTWVGALNTAIGTPDEETIIIGHSIGCQTIVRYLAIQAAGIKVKGIVLVAPFITLTGLETQAERDIAAPWLEPTIDWARARSAARNTVCIFSTNDEFVPLDNVSVFEKELGAQSVILKNRGHFSGSDGIREMPEVLAAIQGLTTKASASGRPVGQQN